MQSSTKRAWLRVATLVLLAIFTGEAVFLYIKWPFTSEGVARSLHGASASRVRFARFQPTFFPHPGCVAHEVTFERGSHTLASARKLTITGSWAALLTLQHYVSRIEPEGARMHIPAEMPPPEPAAASKRPPTTVGEMVANGGVLEIARTPAETAPLIFTFAKLNLRNVSEKNVI